MFPLYHSGMRLSTRMAIRIVITLISLILAILAGIWLGGGAMAFNSPVSPIPYIPTPSNHVTHTPTPATLYEYIEQAATPVFVPVSPIIFHSPIATPGPVCVAVGHWGQVLCYD